MHRFLERFARALSAGVVFVYLTGMALGTASFFAGVRVEPAILAVGIALAAAVEVHSFLEQRQLRAAWQRWRTLPRDVDPEVRAGARAQYRVHLGLTVLLVAFSMFSATGFRAVSWQVQYHHAPAGLADWGQILLIGTIVPAFFFCAAFLVPLHHAPAEALRDTSDGLLDTTLKAVREQWSTRLKRARKSGLDLAPVAVALLLDADDPESARRIQLIADGLARAEGGGGAWTGAAADATHRGDQPPTGPGSPQLVAIGAAEDAGLVGPSISNGRFRRGGSGALRGMSAEERRVRAFLLREPHAGIRHIVRATSVSESTASKWRKVIQAETARSERAV